MFDPVKGTVTVSASPHATLITSIDFAAVWPEPHDHSHLFTTHQQDVILTTGHDGRVLALSLEDASVCPFCL